MFTAIVDNLVNYSYIITFNLIQGHDETSDDPSREVDHVTCHYEYMMRLSQPNVPCPNAATIQSMLEYHEHLMSVSTQNNGMCSEMTYPSSTMVCIHASPFFANSLYLAS